ncbi:N-acyl homoserine lactonase family protein [Rhodococcus koreensis]
MSDVRVVPLCAGTAARTLSRLMMGADPEPLDLTFSIFYVRAGDRHILVDTGVSTPEETASHHHPLGQTAEQDPVAALEGIGVGADEISVVVNTHLHWDHCANNHRFPNATLYAQRSELQYAIAPLPLHRHAYDEIEVEHGMCQSLPGFMRAQLTLIEGDLEIAPNVHILHTPGHSPGSQSVLVSGTETYLIPGDNLPLHQNLNGGQFTPNPIHVDLESYFASIRRSTREADVILPGHDLRVFDHAEYR